MIVTLYVPTVDELKVHVEDPDPPEESVMLDGAHAVETPLGDDAERATVPTKPLRLVRLRLEVAVEPVLKVIVVGLAVSEKSWIAKLMFTEWNRDPVCPVAVTM